MNDETDIYKTWVDYTSKINDDNEIIAGVDYTDVLKQFQKIANEYAVKYKNAEILYAVDSQIEWANRVIIGVKTLNQTEIKLLRKVAQTGSYSSLDRGLLNELLKKYH